MKSSRAERIASEQEQQAPEPKIALESNLVVLDVLVTDDNGNVLSRLKRENFRVLDNGVPQIINTFEPTHDPITIVMLLEYSGIAYNYFAYKAADWGSVFLNYLDSKDWVALITYDLRPTIRVDFTRNKAEVRDSLRNLSFPGFREANLFDALVDTVEKLDHVQGKKSILLLTTGADTFSHTTFEEATNALKKSDVTVFCVGVAESEYQMSEMYGRLPNISYVQAKNQLQTFAELTGGSYWFPRFEGEIPTIFKSIAVFLRSEYIIGFAPPDMARDGKYHRLKVEIVAPDGKPLPVFDAKGKRRKIVVYARLGYVVPRAAEKR